MAAERMIFRSQVHQKLYEKCKQELKDNKIEHGYYTADELVSKSRLAKDARKTIRLTAFFPGGRFYKEKAGAFDTPLDERN